MSTKTLFNSTTAYVLFLLLSVGLSNVSYSQIDCEGQLRTVPSEEISAITTLISSQIRSNYERIRTLQADIYCSKDRIYDGPRAASIFHKRTEGKGEIPETIRRHDEIRFQFAFDAENDLLYSRVERLKPSDYFDPNSGRNLGAKMSAPWYRSSIITPQHFVHSQPNRISEDLVLSHHAIREALHAGSTTKTAARNGVLDPREFLIGRTPIWDELAWILRIIENNAEWNVEGHTIRFETCVQDEITRYIIFFPAIVGPGNYIFTRRVFSSDVGFNLIATEVTDHNGNLLLQENKEYSSINGVYVPSRITKRRFERADGTLSYETVSVFENVQINHTVPSETFTYKHLGLKDGDTYEDAILNKEYIYREETKTLDQIMDPNA